MKMALGTIHIELTWLTNQAKACPEDNVSD